MARFRVAIAAPTALLVLAGGLSGALSLAGRSGPPVGVAAPPLDLPLVKGDVPRFSLVEERGRPVLIEVFASWCRACEGAAPTLAAASRVRRAREVRFVGVSVDDDPFLAAVAAQRWSIPYDVAFDDVGAADTWKVDRLPAVIVVDAAGSVRHVGSSAPTAAELERWLADVGAPRVD